MGFFSFLTEDTKESIQIYLSNKPTIVYMKDNMNNIWIETNYKGYGMFGDKDIFLLFGEMNNLPDDRLLCINEWYNDSKKYYYPVLVSNKDYKWSNIKPTFCEYQGYFYPDDYSSSSE